jgi:hypothetical protein
MKTEKLSLYERPLYAGGYRFYSLSECDCGALYDLDDTYSDAETYSDADEPENYYCYCPKCAAEKIALEKTAPERSTIYYDKTEGRWIVLRKS